MTVSFKIDWTYNVVHACIMFYNYLIMETETNREISVSLK